MNFGYVEAIPIIVYAIYLIICLCIILIALYLANRIIIKIWKGLKYFYLQLKGDLLTKLISLSIVGFFIPLVVPTFINSLFNFFYSFFTSFINTIPSSSRSILQSCKVFDKTDILSGLTDCVEQTTITVIGSFNHSLSRGFSNLNIFNFFWIQLILFLSLWILFSTVINYFRSSLNTDERDNKKSERWIQKILKNSVATNNIVFFIILAMGLYLSFASIAAIPSLQDSEVTPEEVSVERLKIRLTDSLNQFKRRYPIEEDDYNPAFNPFIQVRKEQANPFIELEKYFDILQAKIDNYDRDQLVEIIRNNPEIVSYFSDSAKIVASANNEEDNFIFDNLSLVKEIVFEPIQKFVEDLERQISLRKLTFKNIDELLEKSHIDELLEESHKEIKEGLRKAITKYESENLNRKGSRETINHFSGITDWFDSVVSETDSQLNSCLSSIQRIDQMWKVQSDNWQRQLTRFEEDFWNSLNTSSGNYRRLNYYDYLNDEEENYLSYFRQNQNESFRQFYENCRFVNNNSIQEIPSRPELGSNLGIFGFLVSWLLLTESLPLTLITGLLGFGLLGSACSSFIRESIREPEISPKNLPEILAHKPLVQDLPKVIIIGLSAAIVAFLSVLGSLSIFFTGNGDEANPYALLLVCLIAAVFGEDIWERTREEFNRKRLHKDDAKQPQNEDKQENID